MPKFEVIVTAPKDATYSDSLVRIAIKAKYTYGQNVKGTASFSVVSSGSLMPVVERSVELNGSGFVEFQMSEFKANVKDFENTFDVKVLVTETLTGNVMEDTTELFIRKTKFVVTDLDNDKKYTPGASFTLMVSTISVVRK